MPKLLQYGRPTFIIKLNYNTMHQMDVLWDNYIIYLPFPTVPIQNHTNYCLIWNHEQQPDHSWLWFISNPLDHDSISSPSHSNMGFLRTGGGGPSGVAYCFTNDYYYYYFFSSLFLKLNLFFSRSASKIHWGSIPLVFQKIC